MHAAHGAPFIGVRPSAHILLESSCLTSRWLVGRGLAARMSRAQPRLRRRGEKEHQEHGCGARRSDDAERRATRDEV